MTHIPVRECILCRKKIEKAKMIRIAKNKNGIIADENQKEEGRGAYICPECSQKEELIKKRVLDRAFRMRISDEVYEMLKGDKNG